MPLDPTLTPPLRTLLWRHFNWHLWVGFAIWTGAVLLFIDYQYTEAKNEILHESFYTKNNFQTEALSNKAHEMAEDTVFLLVGGLLLAVVGGLLRKPILAVISRKARTPTELIWQSLLLVEMSIFLLSLIPWPVGYTFGWGDIWQQFRVLFIGSLPWLLTTGFASYRLAAALHLRPSVATEPA